MTDYERGVEQASAVYKEVIREYVAENAKLRELVRLLLWGVDNDMPRYEGLAWSQRVNTLTHELGVTA